MKAILRAVVILAGLLMIPGSAAAANTHDIELTMKALDTTTGRIAAPGPVKIRVTIKNNGPQAIVYEDGLKLSVNKYDHTGQQYLRTIEPVAMTEVPLLASGATGTLDFVDKSLTSGPKDINGNYYTVKAGTFIYKPALKPASGIYSDSKNENQRPELGMIIYTASSSPVKWTSRLREEDFVRAGATLEAGEKSKLLATTYSIRSIALSETDRLVNTQKCNSCHTGASTQSPGNYAPVNPTTFTSSTDHKKSKGDTNATARYNWGNTGKDGVIAAFIASASGKPTVLEKIFLLWLLDGAQQ